MKYIFKNRKRFSLIMLLAVMAVSFPVQEYFHNHHTAEETCKVAHKQNKCEHTSHYSLEEYHAGCVFLLQHTAFTYSEFSYFIEKQFTKDIIAYNVNAVTVFEVQTSSRAPPTFLI